MTEANSSDKNLSLLQKYFLVFLSIFLVFLLFTLRNGFKANLMLDDLAKNSILPEMALSNGRPTVFEFYADWCEACKEMAPDMINVKKQTLNKVDVVLLNVDNPRWVDLINKYDVNGIPQLTFFDNEGKFKGSSLGVIKYNELNEIFLSLINNSDLPNLNRLSNSTNLNSVTDLKEVNSKNIRNSEGPRYHG